MRRVSGFKSVISLTALFATAGSSVALAANDSTERPHGTYIQQDLPTVDMSVRPRGGGATLIIYMNRVGGTFFGGGFNDSTQNQSSIIGSTASLPPFPYGDASWNQVMSCMREIYGPFNIEITDVDPGSTPHMESVVAGSPQDLGMDPQVGGVSPFSCGFINNSIAFTFPEVWGNDPRAICETAAQETAHSFGLDHEFHCPDPMTYLFNCGDKLFRDLNAQCGEYSARACQCGGSTQNSYQEILAMFGPRPNVPPEVSISSPNNDDTVQPGFVINVLATDDIGIDRVEMWIDGVMTNIDQVPPYGFASGDLAEGDHTLQARAVDTSDNTVDTAVITVHLTGPCDGNEDCSATQVCDLNTGICIPGMGTPGGLGEPCTVNEECASGICASDGVDSKCVTSCDVTVATSCPDGYDCLSAGASGVCWPGAGDDGSGGCGCTVGASASTLPLFWLGLAIAGMALVFSRRRRR